MQICARRNRIHLARYVLGIASLLGFAAVSAETTLGFSPATVDLAVGESRIVAVTVSGVPNPGLAGYQVSLRFNTGIAKILNPNEAFRGSIPAFAPLAEIPFCTIVRNTTTCLDPEWLLISSGRTADAVPDTISNVTGLVKFGFGTHGPSVAPLGGGVIGLIEIHGINIGRVTVTLDEFVLASADEPPVPIPASPANLTINVGTVTNQVPDIGAAMFD